VDIVERARKERAAVSLREREKEVQRRQHYRHEEAVGDFQALLTDAVRSADLPWKEAKKGLKRDRRWESASILSREEMEDLFNQHIETIAKKKKLRFR
jgi:transcription elongation regulator 1